MEEIVLRDDFIKLGQALKAAGLVESGVEAKIVIQNGEVKVNGEVCLMRGKKLHKGDKVEFENNGFEIDKNSLFYSYSLFSNSPKISKYFPLQS